MHIVGAAGGNSKTAIEVCSPHGPGKMGLPGKPHITGVKQAD